MILGLITLFGYSLFGPQVHKLWRQQCFKWAPEHKKGYRRYYSDPDSGYVKQGNRVYHSISLSNGKQADRIAKSFLFKHARVDMSEHASPSAATGYPTNVIQDVPHDFVLWEGKYDENTVPYSQHAALINGQRAGRDDHSGNVTIYYWDRNQWPDWDMEFPDMDGGFPTYFIIDVDLKRQRVAKLPGWARAASASSFSGYVDTSVTRGNSRHILWDAGADGNGQFSDQVSFVVTANDGTSPPAPDGMVLIPAGVNSGTAPDCGGSYSLKVSSFYMDRCEVSESKWDEVYNWATNHGYSINRAGSGKAANHPVHTVNWYDCVKWCNARSQKEGRGPAYYTTSSRTTVYKTGEIDITDNCVAWKKGYRLPTDEQWEYAARGGVLSKRFPWAGDTISHSQANYNAGYRYSYDESFPARDHPDYDDGGYPYTSPVGAFGANEYGLHDMSGNVWEWCYDWLPLYEGSFRVLRGGGWRHIANRCRVDYRYHDLPYHCDNSIGFRTVLPGWCTNSTALN